MTVLLVPPAHQVYVLVMLKHLYWSATLLLMYQLHALRVLEVILDLVAHLKCAMVQSILAKVCTDK